MYILTLHLDNKTSIMEFDDSLEAIETGNVMIKMLSKNYTVCCDPGYKLRVTNFCHLAWDSDINIFIELKI